jgi:hypothetical protein
VPRKSELIAALIAIPGDPLVFVDADGRLTDDFKPERHKTSLTMRDTLQRSASIQPNADEDEVVLL